MDRSLRRYMVVAIGEVPLRLLALVRAPVELAEARVAVGDEGAVIGGCHGLAVRALRAKGLGDHSGSPVGPVGSWDAGGVTEEDASPLRFFRLCRISASSME